MSDKGLPEVTIATPGGTQVRVGMVASGYAIGRTKKSRQVVPVYDYRIIEYIAELIRERVRSGFDCILLYTGERRTGKSTLSLQVSRTLDPAFSARQIAFRLEEFNDIIRDLPTADPKAGVYPVAQLDEAGFDLFSQSWMERVQRNMVRKFEVIGAKKLTVPLVLPHRMMLNKSFREGMIHLWVNVSTYESMRGFAELRLGQQNIWQLEMYWKPLCAFTFSSIDSPLWQEYEKKKLAFIEEVTQDREEEHETKGQQLRKQRDMCIRALYQNGAGMTQTKLSELTGISQSQICAILNGE